MNKDDVSDAEMGPVRHPREGVGIDGWSAPLWAEDERGGPWDGTALMMTRPHPAVGSPWRAHLGSGPGYCAWPCLGPGLMGEARPAPDTCRVQGVRGLGDLTHLSTGCQGVSREGPGPMVPGFSPQFPLCPVHAVQRPGTQLSGRCQGSHGALLHLQ